MSRRPRLDQSEYVSEVKNEAELIVQVTFIYVLEGIIARNKSQHFLILKRCLLKLSAPLRSSLSFICSPHFQHYIQIGMIGVRNTL